MTMFGLTRDFPNCNVSVKVYFTSHTPGKLLAINRVHPIPNKDATSNIPTRRISTRKCAGNPTPPTTRHSLPTRARHRIVTQQAIDVLTIQEKVEIRASFIPIALQKHHIQQVAPNLKHYANPMVHPITGETISSYKRLMKDPATAEIWQTAFGKEFGGMAQGDNKTGQKGTSAMFAMIHEDITKILKAGEKFTYANPVVDHRPQKEDPNRIRIVAGGNLIDSTGKLSDQHTPHVGISIFIF
jgi:hypothetical protein